jgi:hypothetical protein
MKDDPQVEDVENSKRNSSWLKDVGVFITFVITLIVPVFWLLGRAYVDGYLAALGLGSFQIEFPVNEYADLGWRILSAFFAVLLRYAGTTGIILSLSLGIGHFLFEAISGVRLEAKLPSSLLSKVKVLQSIVQRSPLLGYWILFLIIGWSGQFVLVKFTDVLNVVSKVGSDSGKKQLLVSSQEIEFASSVPLGLESGTHVSLPGNGNTDQFIYHGYRLLMDNNGKYYLFRELDPSTCKPKQVYIVSQNLLLYTSRLTLPSPTLTCPSTSNSPTPTEQTNTTITPLASPTEP